VAEERRASTVAPWRDKWVITIVAAGLLTSLALFFVAKNYDEAQQRTSFEDESKQLASHVQREILPASEIVASIASFFESSREVSAADFEAFTRPAMNRRGSLAAVEWAPRVMAADRATFEQAEDGDDPLVIREPDGEGGMMRATDRQEYYPIKYMVPVTDMVIGLDVGFEAGRRGDIARTLERGEVSASARFKLVEDPEGIFSVAIYVPAYEGGKSQVQDNLAGLAIGLVRIEPLVKGAVDTASLGRLGLVMVDEDASDDARILYATSSQAVAVLDEAEPDHVYETALMVGGRHWKVVTVSLKPLGTRGPWYLLAGSLLVTLAVASGVGGLRHIARLRVQMKRAKRLGQYQLVAKLGAGGMGEVYEAKHAMMRRPTAVKVIQPSAVGEQTLVRFEREANAASVLTHPNAVTVFDFGRTPEGALYYAMELVQGIDLEALVRLTGPLPPARVVHLAVQACGALAEAHGHGLIHRDIKPSNIMVCQQGGIDDFVKVFDFGLVKVDEPVDGNPNLSMNVELLGTPHYMSPEQMLSPSEVQPAADVYALGGVLYFLIAGTEVFTGTSTDRLVSKCLTEPPTPLSERVSTAIDPDLEALVMRCLSKAPEDRPQDAGALRRELMKLRNMPTWTEADAAEWWHGIGTPLLKERINKRKQPVEFMSVALGERDVTDPVPPSFMSTLHTGGIATEMDGPAAGDPAAGDPAAGSPAAGDPAAGSPDGPAAG
jgi:serine/threonine protein kinase/CHASE1-domain containing sensor protein